jgi:Rrf2 family nitric oxide-sensitive transcriptional repressor
MNITQHTDYAFRVLMYLGTCPARRVTIKEVAERFDISRTHLMKVVTALVANGFVDGARGKGGGLRLARAPAQIGLGDVVRQMEPSLELVECFGSKSHCLLDPACRLKGALGGALQAFFAALDRLTLADLVGDDPALHAALGIPPPAPQPARPTIAIAPDAAQR